MARSSNGTLLCRTQKRGLEEEAVERTGLVLDPYFSGTKAKWLLDNVPHAETLQMKGLTVWNDRYLACLEINWGARHGSFQCFTDLLYNINTMAWDPVMLEMLDIPECVLPEVVDNNAIVGETRGLGFFLTEFPWRVWQVINNPPCLVRLVLSLGVPNVLMERVRLY